MMSSTRTRPATSEAAIVRCVTTFTERAADDAGFRRALVVRPAAALAAVGLEVTGPDAARGLGPLTIPPGRPALTGDADLAGPPAHFPAAPSELPLDIRLVQYALRPMALLHAPARVAAQLRAAAAGQGLYAVLTPWHFRPVADLQSNGYVNMVQDARLGIGDTPAWQGVLVSADMRYVAVGWLSLYYGWDELLGLALGYPACCVDAFPARWRLAADKFGGEVGDVLVRTYPQHTPIVITHPAMNIFARHFGYHLIEHFPCRFSCSETTRLAARLVDGLAFFEPDTARELTRALAAPAYRHRAGETFLFPDGRFDARGTLTYQQVWASDPGSAISRSVLASRTLVPGGDGWLLRSGAVN
jgi:hypothetical protein